MSNLDDFIIHSQYPVEKIVWTAEGVSDSTNPNWHNTSWGGRVFEPIDDSLDYLNVLIDGIWSDDDWQTQYQLEGYNEKSQSVSAIVLPRGTDFDGYILPTNCVLLGGSASDESLHLKYKLWAYLRESDWGSSITEKTAETLAYRLQKDTRLAQLNLISENFIHVPNTTTQTIYHNLGYRPFCKIWQRFVFQGEPSEWSKYLWTLTTNDTESQFIQNNIIIDSEKITISVDDRSTQEYQAEAQDFIVRIYNYAIPI